MVNRHRKVCHVFATIRMPQLLIPRRPPTYSKARTVERDKPTVLTMALPSQQEHVTGVNDVHVSTHALVLFSMDFQGAFNARVKPKPRQRTSTFSPCLVPRSWQRCQGFVNGLVNDYDHDAPQRVHPAELPRYVFLCRTWPALPIRILPPPPSCPPALPPHPPLPRLPLPDEVFFVSCGLERAVTRTVAAQSQQQDTERSVSTCLNQTQNWLKQS